MGPSPHLWFCAFTTATLWPELIVSIGPRPHLSFCACITARLAPEILVSKGPWPQLSFCAFKITWLASELLVSMSASTHLWLLHAKQRLLDQNYKSLWVPALINFVVFACKTATLGPELQAAMGSRPYLWLFASKTAALAPELLVSIGPCPHLWLLHAKQRLLDQNYKSL